MSEIYKNQIRITGINATVDGLAWVYAFPVVTGKEYEVEDENGNISKFYKNTGGEIVIAKNIDIKKGEKIGNVNFLRVHNLFDYINYLKSKNLWNNN